MEELSDIICNVDTRVGEVRRFCSLQPEGDVLSLSKHQTIPYDRGLGGGEEIQSAHMADALHASQSSEDHDGVIV